MFPASSFQLPDNVWFPFKIVLCMLWRIRSMFSHSLHINALHYGKSSPAILYKRKQSGNTVASSTNSRSAFPKMSIFNQYKVYISSRTLSSWESSPKTIECVRTAHSHKHSVQHRCLPLDSLTCISFYFHVLLHSVLFGVSLGHMFTKWEYDFIPFHQS